VTSKKTRLEKTETETETKTETSSKDKEAIEKLSRRVKLYQKQLQDMKNKYQQVCKIEVIKVRNLYQLPLSLNTKFANCGKKQI
jgi:hypothetical protein